MTALGLVNAPAQVPKELTEAKASFALRLEDAFATDKHLWIRGRFINANAAVEHSGEHKPWWKKWWNKTKESGTLPSLHLRTNVGGKSFDADIPLHADGHFEALLAINVPPPKRGWWVAKNQIQFADITLEACNVVLVAPQDSTAAILVLLPLEFTSRPPYPYSLSNQQVSSQLAERLADIRAECGRDAPIYYLACVPPPRRDCQVELALAGTGNGWPPGHFVLMAGDQKSIQEVYSRGVERFRWLLAGAKALIVLNFEPSVTHLPVEAREPAEEWAAVQRVIDCRSENGVPRENRPRENQNEISGHRPTRSVLLPRHPVVFCHGMLAFSMLKMKVPEDSNCFARLRDYLLARGFRALFPQVPPTAGVAQRAECLRDQIRHWTEEPVNLIAHSMGGLDARYLITHLDMGDRIKSLTTVSTPHRGTYLADWFLANYRNRIPLLLAFEAFGINVDGFRDCRLAACQEFNAKTPNDPRVHYFSMGGEVSPARLTPVLRRAWNILTPVEGPNDGMVSVASARWEEYLGTVHADHFAQTPDAMFLRPGEDFDSLAFYTRMVEDLARRGY